MTLIPDAPPGALASAKAKAAAPAAVSIGEPKAAAHAQHAPVSLPQGVVESRLSPAGQALAEMAKNPDPALRPATSPTIDAINAELADAAQALREDAAQQAALASVQEDRQLEAAAADQQPPTSAAVPGQPAAKPARRAPPSIVERSRILGLIQAADATTPDATLAASISLALGRAVGNGMVSSYRKQLGLASVRMPTRSELAAKLAAAEAELAARRQPGLPVDATQG